MGYGPNKYKGREFIDGICDHIRGQLLKQGEFQNNSLGYFGVSFDYKIRIKLLARGENLLELIGEGAKVGVPDERGEVPNEVLQASLNSTEEDVKAVVEGSGGSSAGTATHTQPATTDKRNNQPHTRLREVQKEKVKA